jgi:hypothetical protein
MDVPLSQKDPELTILVSGGAGGEAGWKTVTSRSQRSDFLSDVSIISASRRIHSSICIAPRRIVLCEPLRKVVAHVLKAWTLGHITEDTPQL